MLRQTATGSPAGNPREQEGAEEKGEQGEGEGARPAETPGAVGVGEAVAAGRHGSEQGRGGGRCREWGSVLYCDEQGRRAGNEGKPGEPAADDGPQRRAASVEAQMSAGVVKSLMRRKSILHP